MHLTKITAMTEDGVKLYIPTQKIHEEVPESTTNKKRRRARSQIHVFFIPGNSSAKSLEQFRIETGVIPAISAMVCWLILSPHLAEATHAIVPHNTNGFFPDPR